MVETEDTQIELLVVDDERSVATVLTALLQQAGYRVHTAFNGNEALRVLENAPVDLVLTDLRMPGLDGMRLLELVREQWPEIAVIILTAHGSVPTAVAAMKIGAADFLTKPFDREDVLQTVQRALSASQRGRQRPPCPRAKLAGIFGGCLAMRELERLVHKAAQSRATALIQGESGTGKELLARSIHAQGERSTQPFVVVDCAAIPENLMESELFGYSRGAFTGAHKSKPGRVELAQGGTLFLDEIGELPLSLQTKLLRLLQEREFLPLGATKAVRADVRFVAATHRDLAVMVRAGSFREDLYYRLNVISIQVPPLRDRPSDVAALTRSFLERFAEENARPVLRIEPEAVAVLEAHAWPGNVRELQNLVESLVVLTDGPVVDASTVRTALARRFGLSGSFLPMSAGDEADARRLDSSRLRAEREAVVLALQRAGGNRAQAARLLGVSRRTLYNKLSAFELT